MCKTDLLDNVLRGRLERMNSNEPSKRFCDDKEIADEATHMRLLAEINNVEEQGN